MGGILNRLGPSDREKLKEASRKTGGKFNTDASKELLRRLGTKVAQYGDDDFSGRSVSDEKALKEFMNKHK